MRGICPNCEKETDLEFIETTEIIKVKGEPMEAHIQYYRCDECGKELEDPRPDYDPLEEAYMKYHSSKIRRANAIFKRFAYAFLAINLLLGFLIYYALETPKPTVVQLNGKAGKIYLLPNETYFPTLRKKLAEAQKEVQIAAFLFKTDGLKTNWARIILDDLIEAKSRGIKVQVFLDRQDTRSPFYNSELARINEQTMEQLKGSGIPATMDFPYKTTHCKLVIIDRRLVFLGSHNLTKSAFKYNNELSVMIESPGLAKEVLDYLYHIQNEKPSRFRAFRSRSGD